MLVPKLSLPQEAAVNHVSGPAIVTAGAGSGKTRTLTSKIAYLVNDLGYDPAKILAITFTNKAAAEMKARLREATGRPIESFPWVKTFHSACFKILREHCDLLGYRKPLMIHDESQQLSHLKKVLADLDLDRKFLYPASSMISRAKNSGEPERYIQVHGRLPRKMEIYRLYNERLEECNSVDFDDILLLTCELFKKYPEIRTRYQEAFDYILIDEFQDSNDIQNQITSLLVRNGNLTVVGDDYQSIYKFRGADPGHFINFPKKYEDARVFRLEENFRSTAQIVQASDTLIACNPHRIEKNCFSRREGEPIRLNHFMDEEEEAEWVARKCWELAIYKKIPLTEIAILFRTKFTSLPFERALRAAKIPYVMAGAQGFFQRREIQDVNAYLVCAVNERDDISFERILNVPKRGIGPGALSKILVMKSPGISLQQAALRAVEAGILPKKTTAALEKLLSFLRSLKREKPSAAIERVIGEMDYEEHLKSISEGEEELETRRQNLKQMIFDAAQKETIPEYLEDANLLRDDQDMADSKTGIRLSTIHAAKGLEFHAVFVVALEEGILPHHRSVGPAAGGENGDGLQEERRLMYVAMTRASDRLFLSYSMSRRGESMAPSRFLNEMGVPFL